LFKYIVSHAHVDVTLTDFGYPVEALLAYSRRLVDYVAFQIFEYEHTR